MTNKNTKYTAFQIRTTKNPVQKQYKPKNNFIKVPNHKGRSHRQQINNNNLIGVYPAVIVVHGENEDIGQKVYFQHNGKKVYKKAQ